MHEPTSCHVRSLCDPVCPYQNTGPARNLVTTKPVAMGLQGRLGWTSPTPETGRCPDPRPLGEHSPLDLTLHLSNSHPQINLVTTAGIHTCRLPPSQLQCSFPSLPEVVARQGKEACWL